MKVNYPIKEEYIEEIEKLAAYYRYHTVEAMNKKHPEFVEEDFKQLLRIAENIITYI